MLLKLTPAAAPVGSVEKAAGVTLSLGTPAPITARRTRSSFARYASTESFGSEESIGPMTCTA